MKECPTCKAKCFDDMETCFSCLYSFREEHGSAREMALPVPEGKTIEIPAITVVPEKISAIKTGIVESRIDAAEDGLMLCLRIPLQVGQVQARCVGVPS